MFLVEHFLSFGMRQRHTAGNRSIVCRCGAFTREGQRYCNECHARWARNNRPKHSELPEEAKRRAAARAKLHVYVKRGKVTKGVCSVCGEVKVEAHHEDYSKPLDVIWYCRKHHIRYHEDQKVVEPTFVLIGDKVVRIKPNQAPNDERSVATGASSEKENSATKEIIT